MAITAPRPILRCGSESPPNRIAVDVFQLLDPLLSTAYVEVVITSLPETPMMSDELLATDCLSDWIAEARVERSGSVTSKCTCSGITT
jgi:hypothetical protein